MPDPARTPTFTSPAAVSVPISLGRDEQFQELMHAKKTMLLRHSTVNGSSDGTTADTNDNLAAPSDWDIGTAGNGAWIHGVFNHSTSPYGGSTLYWLLYVNDTSPNPQTFGFRVATQAYTGGSTSSLPTTPGVETVVNTAGDDIYPFSSPTEIRYIASSTAEGDFLFLVKEEGNTNIQHVMWIPSYFDGAGGGGGKGANRFGLFMRSNSTADAFTLANLSTTGNWEGFEPGSGAINTTIEMRTSAADITLWTNGQDFQGAVVDFPFYHLVDSPNTAGGRLLGVPPDVYGTPTAIVSGIVDDSETAQTFRRVTLETGPIIYYPTAELPIA